MNKELEKYKNRIQEFADQRDWDQFHTLKNLSMALSVEVSELMEHFQWEKSDVGFDTFSEEKKIKISEEMIDIWIYWLRLADKMNIDFEEAFEKKFKINQEKYPAELVRGNSKKYTDY